MSGKMERNYFDEKKELATDGFPPLPPHHSQAVR